MNKTNKILCSISTKGRYHMLDESFFPGFKFKFVDGDGNLTDELTERGNLDSIKLMLCIWDKPVDETSN